MVEFEKPEIISLDELNKIPSNEVIARLQGFRDQLMPGGCLKIGVPDFSLVAETYRRRIPIDVNTELGGATFFDRETMHELFYAAGFERIGLWKPETPNPMYLYLQAFKKSVDIDYSGTQGIASLARFGPSIHHRCVYAAIQKTGIRYSTLEGCFWWVGMCNQMEAVIADPSCKYVLTFDYDTVFTVEDIAELHRLMDAYPEADAIAAVQSSRGNDTALFSVNAPDGGYKKTLYQAEFDCNLTKVSTAHFGLTLIRADRIRAMAKPWMTPIPDKDGGWTEGKTDPDIAFWRNWERCGFSLYMANRVPVGHLKEVVLWPAPLTMKRIYQDLTAYCAEGIPKEVIR